MAEVQQYRAVKIFKLGGKVYAFDYTTIGLCITAYCMMVIIQKKMGVKR